MSTKTIDIQEAQHQLLELIDQVIIGTEIILVDGTMPRARLVPITQTPSQRIPGLHLGSMIASPDFDDPLPDNFWMGDE